VTPSGAPDERPSLRYVVKRRGYTQAAFVYAKDAQEFVAIQRFPNNFVIEEAESERRVVGTTAHGNAILAKLDRPDPPTRTTL
jgi:hypothetical protein